jgi:hypothetical protein
MTGHDTRICRRFRGGQWWTFAICTPCRFERVAATREIAADLLEAHISGRWPS